MRYSKTIQEIDPICQRYGIINYSINQDGSIDVIGDVDIRSRNLTELPLIFNSVSGNFYCQFNFLTTLEGCPKFVGGNFDCELNRLTTLKGCPSEVGGYFDCSSNKITLLIGCPEIVGGHFGCTNCQLISLVGCPRKINKSFNCSKNDFTTLEGCPEIVGGDFNCSKSKLTSLEGCPIEVGGEFNCRENKIYDPYHLKNFNFDAFLILGNPIICLFDIFGSVKDFKWSLEWNYVFFEDGEWFVSKSKLSRALKEANKPMPKSITKYDYNYKLK